MSGLALQPRGRTLVPERWRTRYRTTVSPPPVIATVFGLTIAAGLTVASPMASTSSWNRRCPLAQTPIRRVRPELRSEHAARHHLRLAGRRASRRARSEHCGPPAYIDVVGHPVLERAPSRTASRPVRDVVMERDCPTATAASRSPRCPALSHPACPLNPIRFADRVHTRSDLRSRGQRHRQSGPVRVPFTVAMNDRDPASG